MGYIYKVTNKINGKQYIGQSICADIKNRWRQHKAKDGIGKYLLAAYNKYGIKNFIYTIICICFDEDCNRFEEEYINKYNTLAPNGYNLQKGGKRVYTKRENNKLSEEHKQKIRNKLTGKKLTEEHKIKLGNASRGRKLSEEHKQKISKTMLNNRKPSLNKEPKKVIVKDKKIKEPRIKQPKVKKIKEPKEKRNILNKEKCLEILKKRSEENKKKIGRFDNNNNLLEEFTSITEASNKYNISRSTISKVCLNKPSYKSAGGFIWKQI